MVALKAVNSAEMTVVHSAESWVDLTVEKSVEQLVEHWVVQ